MNYHGGICILDTSAQKDIVVLIYNVCNNSRYATYVSVLTMLSAFKMYVHMKMVNLANHTLKSTTS